MEKAIIEAIMKLIAILTPSGVGQVLTVLLEKQEEESIKSRKKTYMGFWHSPLTASQADEALKQYAAILLPGVNLAEVKRINLVRALAKKAKSFPSQKSNFELLEKMMQQHDCELRYLRMNHLRTN